MNKTTKHVLRAMRGVVLELLMALLVPLAILGWIVSSIVLLGVDLWERTEDD